MPVPVSRNQARLVAKVLRARVRVINDQLDRPGPRTPRDGLLVERRHLLELVRMFEVHGDRPASSEQFGELDVMELNTVARACRQMVAFERAEEERLRQCMSSYKGGTAETLERLAAYFQRRADGG